MDDEKLLTLGDLCRIAQIKESHARSAVFRKEISYRKVGKLLRFTREDINKFINRNYVQATAEKRGCHGSN